MGPTPPELRSLGLTVLKADEGGDEERTGSILTFFGWGAISSLLLLVWSLLLEGLDTEIEEEDEELLLVLPELLRLLLLRLFSLEWLLRWAVVSRAAWVGGVGGVSS